MTQKIEQDKARDIETSLQQTSQALARMRDTLPQTDSLPAQVNQLEKRLLKLQQEVDDVSGAMLSYKLKRIADSKMLSSASAAVRTVGQPVEYQSATFKCKSDLDQCLLAAGNTLDKALCYALFIRCALKS